MIERLQGCKYTGSSIIYPPNNIDIMYKINEIIDHINKPEQEFQSLTKSIMQNGYIMNDLNKVELSRCPHCNSKMNIVEIQYGYAIVCTNKNCLGGMQIKYGSSDNKIMFLTTLISNWNKRSPEVRAVTAAIECIEEYRNSIHEQMQEPYDDHGQCCIDVLDEVLNRLHCFTSSEAVEVWIKELRGGS